MSEKKSTKVLVEIYKPERGGSRTGGYSVSELPLFSTKMKWQAPVFVQTTYVLDFLVHEECPLYKISESFMEACNEKWNECIENNLDFLSFTYVYEYD